MWFTGIQVNHNTSFKRITLLFVYFWQVIFFWAVMLHITKSNIGNISQTLRQEQFCQNSRTANVFRDFLFSREFSTAFSYFSSVSDNLILQIRRIQQTRTTRKNKITNQGRICNLVKHIWWTVFAKIVNVF